MKNISTYKDKILQFIEHKGLSKNKFYIETGLSNGTLDKKSGLTIKTAEKIFSTYSDLSVEWFFRDNGEMIINSNSIEKDNALNIAAEPGKEYLETRVKDLEQENKMLKGVINKFLGEDNGNNGKSGVG